jgi:hypothetical protein
VVSELCAAGYGVSAGLRFCLIYPDRSIEDNNSFALAGPISQRLEVPVLAAFVYDSDTLEMEVHRSGTLVHAYHSWPDVGWAADHGDDGVCVPWCKPEPIGADPTAFLDFAAGPVNHALLDSALANDPVDPTDADVDGDDSGYVWAQAQHGDVLTALGHPDHVVSLARWDYFHLRRPWAVLPAGIEWSDLTLFGAAETPPLMTPELLAEIRALLPGNPLGFDGIARRLGITTGAIFGHVLDLKDVIQGRTQP